jgi:hypothetical protein
VPDLFSGFCFLGNISRKTDMHPRTHNAPQPYSLAAVRRRYAALQESYEIADANGLADFSLLGDLPSIVGRASGLKTRILAATAIRQNTYIAVPADSTVQNVKDLRGRRVAFQNEPAARACARHLSARLLPLGAATCSFTVLGWAR